MTLRPSRTDYRGERPSAYALHLERLARDQRQRDLAGTRPPIITRLAKFIRQSFGV